MIRIFDAPPAPRGLLFVATFSQHDRAEIARHPELMRAMHEADARRVGGHHSRAPAGPARGGSKPAPHTFHPMKTACAGKHCTTCKQRPRHLLR